MPPPKRKQSVRRQRHLREHLARREDILTAARKVFARQGYGNATMDAIAAQADFGKGTVYNYFRNKADLFTHVVLSLLDEYGRTLQQAIREAGGTRAVFERFAKEAILHYQKNEDVTRIIVREMNRFTGEQGDAASRAVFTKMEHSAGQLAGVFTDDSTFRALSGEEQVELARVFLSLLHARTMRFIMHGRGIQHLDAAREAAFITRLFFDGANAS